MCKGFQLNGRPEYFLKQFIVNLYKKILQSGTQYASTEAEKMTIQNHNFIFMIAVPTVWSYVPIDLYAKDLPLLLLNFFTGVGYTICFFMIRNGYSKVAKVVSYHIAIFSIFLTADAVGKHALVNYYQLSAAILPFLSFVRKDFWLMILCSFDSLLFWFLDYFLPSHLIMPPALHPEYYTPIVPVIVLPALIVGIVLQTYTLFHKLLEQSERQKKELIISNRLAALGEMSGGVAHEINTPLNIISTSAAIIQFEMEKPVVSKNIILERVDSIEKTVQRISKITKALVDFSRFDKKGYRFIDKKSVAINNTINTVINLCEEKFRSSGIDLKKHLAADCFLNLDESLFSQILMNILNNAFDAVSKMPNRWIEISGKLENNNYYLMIRDSGEGIPPDIADKLMEPFFTTKEIGKGTGLGLSTSKGFIEGMGGKLYYELHEGHTAFICEFPA